MGLLLGQYDFTITSSAPTTTLALVPNTTDSAGTYGPGEGEHKQEFRRLPANVVAAVEAAVLAAVTDATMTDIELDVDLGDAQAWDNQLDRIFQNAETGYGRRAAPFDWVLSRDIVSNVRELRLTR